MDNNIREEGNIAHIAHIIVSIICVLSIIATVAAANMHANADENHTQDRSGGNTSVSQPVAESATAGTTDVSQSVSTVEGYKSAEKRDKALNKKKKKMAKSYSKAKKKYSKREVIPSKGKQMKKLASSFRKAKKSKTMTSFATHKKKYDKALASIKKKYSNLMVNESKDTRASNHLTKSSGVCYYNGRRETYYSQRVLPGGGLSIPGRHVGRYGLVYDKYNYICVASNDYGRGTVLKTSLGLAKVYDSGCDSGTVDIYCNW